MLQQFYAHSKKLSSSSRCNIIPEWRVSNVDCCGQFGGDEIGF